MTLRQPGWPVARAGMSVGLLGGSFDPAHEGHVHITREAMKRFALDRVWWLVSPGNPLKSRGPAPLDRRIAAARAVMQHPRVDITALERDLGTSFTADTIARLQTCYPGVRLVWLMGADNLASFHHWENWQWILGNVPLGVLARPRQRISARRSPAAELFRDYRLSGRKSRLLATGPAPRWCFVNVPMRAVSSSAIRAQGAWPG